MVLLSLPIALALFLYTTREYFARKIQTPRSSLVNQPVFLHMRVGEKGGLVYETSLAGPNGPRGAEPMFLIALSAL